LNQKGKEELSERFENPGLKYGEVKKELFEIIWEYFAIPRDNREKYLNDRSYVMEALKKGADRARTVSSTFVTKAWHNVGIDY